MNIDLINDLKSYFENRADADHEGESYRPNAEMRFFSQIVEYEESSKNLVKVARLTSANLRDLATGLGRGHKDYSAVQQLAERLYNATI